MQLAFIDIAYDYAADRPDADERLGGTTSAVCFLARALTQAGIACTFFNKVTVPRTAHGIRSLPLGDLAEALGDPGYSAFIFCGRWLEGMVRLAREHTKTPLIAWMHESAFGPEPVRALDSFDGVVFVSAWQQGINQIHTHPRWRQAMIPNAMNPLAAHLFENGSPALAAKAVPPILLYAGHFQRGAFHLPKILDHLRSQWSDFTMEIFCNINPSGDDKVDTQYINWLRRLPNITHVGMVGQPELIRHMRRAAVFVAPNPWPETSCIALIEAMAAGLSVVTTNRAALPETASGFAHIISIDDPDHPVRFDAPISPEIFARTIASVLETQQNQPEKTEQRLRAQIDHFLAHYQWHQRVAPWTAFVRSLG